VQEWLAYHLFEALHLHAERRLRPANLRRRNADRSRARNDSKVSEQCKVKDRHVIKINRYPDKGISICLVAQARPS